MEDHDKQLLDYIKEKIDANRGHPYAPDEMKDYYEGANTALEELAVNFGLVDGYGEL